MISIRDLAASVPGWRYIIENICTHSGPGQRLFHALPFLTDSAAIEDNLNEVQQLIRTIDSKQGMRFYNDCAHLLCNVLDIRNTIEELLGKNLLDDIALFQIKDFALTAQRIRTLCDQHQFNVIRWPDLEATINTLDPEKKRVRDFYVYEAYDPELLQERKALQKLTEAARKAYADGNSSDEAELEDAITTQRLKTQNVEDRVRKRIIAELYTHANDLKYALEAIGRLDLRLAQARFAIQEQLTRPTITEDHNVHYSALVHLAVRARLQEQKLKYQPIDLELTQGVTLITGANMAGKSVLLQSVLLAQLMLQFGMYVPAQKASMRIFSAPFASFGDREDTQGGLSSFGAEMLHLNDLISRINAQEKPIALIDELARTTNPIEGAAIVNGVITYLNQNGITALVTTHYSNITAPCKKLRVKGFTGKSGSVRIGLAQLNASMDYTLEEVTEGDVPQEALAVARILGVDKKLIALCEHFLQ